MLSKHRRVDGIFGEPTTSGVTQKSNSTFHLSTVSGNDICSDTLVLFVLDLFDERRETGVKTGRLRNTSLTGVVCT